MLISVCNNLEINGKKRLIFQFCEIVITSWYLVMFYSVIIIIIRDDYTEIKTVTRSTWLLTLMNTCPSINTKTTI